jgi:hypothetical protein
VLALVVGTLLALAALGYVLWPLIKAAEEDDAAEAEIRRARAQLRVCPDCGPRPESAARYCSRCGRALA